MNGFDRRTILAGGVATLALPAVARAAPASVAAADAQPVLAGARRTIAALARVGEPVAAADIAAIDRLAASGDLPGAAQAALRLLDARTLLIATVSPEARVSVTVGAARPDLVQAGWRVFLVRVDNPALVPGRLDATSPEAKPVNNRYPVGHRHADAEGREDRHPVAAGDIAQRWLDIDVFDAAPLPATLDAVPVEYRVLAVYARDAGRRAARLFVDIGPGSGDLGDRGYAALTFTATAARTVALSVRDSDGKPVTCSLRVRDTQGRTYPAPTKRALPDLYFQQQVYRADGETLTLPAGDYQVEAARGPEYLIARSMQTVAPIGAAHWQFDLARWIDPRVHGYHSGDHHIHAAGCAHYTSPEEGVPPSVMAPQVAGEGLGIGAVLTWGPGFYTQKLNFSGRDDPVSTVSTRLHYDLEVSGFPSSHCGHLVMLQVQAMDYPGTTKIEQWPSSNTPVLDWGRRQHAVQGYAHSGWGLVVDTEELPNFRMPAFDGIGANDYIVTVTAGLVDFISGVSTPFAAELNIWYHTLNAGFRTRIAGETDWPCIYDERTGMGRSYVKLDGPLTYDGWCAGLKAGRGYISEGRAHLMNFRATSGRQSVAMGWADIVLAAPAAVAFEVLVAARLEPAPTPTTEAIRSLGPLDKPYWHLERVRIGATRMVLVELLVDGRAVASRAVPADGVERAMRFDYMPERSCWVAMRIAKGAHTNPIWVSVADAPVRDKRSIAWCRAAVDQCWAQKKLRIRPAELAAEAVRYDAARAVYDARLKEAG